MHTSITDQNRRGPFLHLSRIIIGEDHAYIYHGSKYEGGGHAYICLYKGVKICENMNFIRTAAIILNLYRRVFSGCYSDTKVL